MNSKNNHALFGVILIIIGVYVLISKSLGGVFDYLPYLALGATFLLLYRNKRHTLALILGVMLVEFGIYYLLLRYNVLILRFPYVAFFFVPGTVFITLFLTKNRQGLLIPGSFLLWMGFGLCLKSFFQNSVSGSSLVTICIGMAFITVYLLGNLLSVKTYLYVGFVITLIGIYTFFRNAHVINLTKIGWFAVIALGIIMIIKSRSE